MNDYQSRAPRIRAGIPVAVSLPGSAGGLEASYPGHVRDLHLDGIGLNHEGLDANEGDVVCVQFPDAMPHGLSVPGRVVWRDGLGLGVKVEGLGPGARDRYRALVTSLLGASHVIF
jgi:hypothetical protein